MISLLQILDAAGVQIFGLTVGLVSVSLQMIFGNGIRSGVIAPQATSRLESGQGDVSTYADGGKLVFRLTDVIGIPAT